jgi:hypothetical protein
MAGGEGGTYARGAVSVAGRAAAAAAEEAAPTAGVPAVSSGFEGQAEEMEGRSSMTATQRKRRNGPIRKSKIETKFDPYRQRFGLGNDCPL